MMEQGTAKRQEIKMLNRKLLEITGVINVESFDNEQFLLETECGFLTITGNNLHIKHLTLEQGRVAIEGHVDTMAYLDANTQQKSKHILSKLFK